MRGFVPIYLLSIAVYISFILRKDKDVKDLWVYEAFFKMWPCIVLTVEAHGKTNKAKAAAFAFALSALGDAALCHNDYKETELSFVLGLVAFLAAQWCYVYCFSKTKTKSRAGKQGSGLVRTLGCYAYAGGLYAFLYGNLGQIKIPVLFYCVSIATTFASSLDAASRSKHNQSSVFGILGAVLFVMSDSSLALNMFVGPVVPHARLVIMSTYWTAQLFLALCFKG